MKIQSSSTPSAPILSKLSPLNKCARNAPFSFNVMTTPKTPIKDTASGVGVPLNNYFTKEEPMSVELDNANPEHLEAVADFLASLDHKDDLDIAASPHKKIISSLRTRANDLIEAFKVAQLKATLVAAAQALFENVDQDLLPDGTPDWEQLTDEQQVEWFIPALASLRAVGAIEVTEEQVDALLALTPAVPEPATKPHQTETNPVSEVLPDLSIFDPQTPVADFAPLEG